MSSTANNPALDGNGFLDLLAKDGITLLSTDKYGKGLLKPQYNNFAPRFGFAYQVDERLVARGGAGLFYNAFENQGYGPNIGENYPFVYNTEYAAKVPERRPSRLYPPSHLLVTTRRTLAARQQVRVEPRRLSPASPALHLPRLTTNASGLGLQGLQFNFVTPRTVAANLSVQYALTHSISAQVGYVLTKADNLQMNLGANNVTALLAYNASTTGPVGGGTPAGQEPFPDFGGGSTGRMIGASIYNGLQTKLEQQFSSGLNYLVTYTFSRTFTDAGDLLNGGSLNGARAPDVPGFGVRGDWSLASFNITNVFHFSGGYELPTGQKQEILCQREQNRERRSWRVDDKLDHYPSGRPASLSRLPDWNDRRHRLLRCDRSRAEPEARNQGSAQCQPAN